MTGGRGGHKYVVDLAPKELSEIVGRNLSVACCRGGCGNLLTVCHKARGLPSQVLTVASQKEVNFD